MTNLELDDAQIGPLSSSRIGNAPVAWGTEPDFTIADEDTREYVEREVARYRRAAQRIWQDEVRSLLIQVREDAEPSGVLHGTLRWGPISVERLAGYLGRTVGDVKARLDALELLGIVRSIGDTESAQSEYEVDVSAELLGS